MMAAAAVCFKAAFVLVLLTGVVSSRKNLHSVPLLDGNYSHNNNYQQSKRSLSPISFMTKPVSPPKVPVIEMRTSNAGSQSSTFLFSSQSQQQQQQGGQQQPYYPGSCNPRNKFPGLKVSIGFYIYTLIDVDDLKETAMVTADLYFSWHDECIWKEALRRTRFPITNDQHISIDAETFPYKVPILHLNSAVNQQAVEKNSYLMPAEIFSNGLVERNSVGEWTTRCSMSHRRYPLDEVDCNFQFLSWLTQDYVNFTSAEMSQAVDVMPFTTARMPWRLISLSANTSKLCFAMSDERSYCSSMANFSMKMRRISSAYVTTILLPCLILFVVFLTSFALPPNKHRCVIFLSTAFGFGLLQYSIKQSLPNIDSGIYLVLHVNFYIVLNSISAVYTLIIVGNHERILFTRHVVHFDRHSPTTKSRNQRVTADCDGITNKADVDTGNGGHVDEQQFTIKCSGGDYNSDAGGEICSPSAKHPHHRRNNNNNNNNNNANYEHRPRSCIATKQFAIERNDLIVLILLLAITASEHIALAIVFSMPSSIF